MAKRPKRGSNQPQLPAGFQLIDTIDSKPDRDILLVLDPGDRQTKVLKIASGTASSTRKAFETEASILRHFAGHPCVVDLVAAQTARGERPYLVLERLGLGSLADRLEKGPLSTADACRMGIAIAGALGSAHESDPVIVHRDVKPGNIFVRADGSYVLGDFGGAVIGETDAPPFGALDYVAPELTFGNAKASRSADIYSLGATMFHAICGKPPFAGPAQDEDGLIRRIRTETPAIEVDVPLKLRRAIYDSLDKQPGKRPDARKIARAFQDTLGELGEPSAEFVLRPIGFGATTAASDPAPASLESDPLDRRGSRQFQPEPTERRGGLSLAAKALIAVGIIGAAVLGFAFVKARGNSETTAPRTLDTVDVGNPTETTVPSELDSVAKAPTDQKLSFGSDGKVTLSWQSTSRTVKSFVIAQATYPVDPTTNQPATTPSEQGYVSYGGSLIAAGKLSDTDANQLLQIPPDQTEANFEIPPEALSSFTCFRVVALGSAGESVASGHTCAPGAPPKAPTLSNASDVMAPQAGPVPLQWSDNSNDESGFAVLTLTPDASGNVIVEDVAPLPAASTSSTVDGGEGNCYAVVAINALDPLTNAIGKPLGEASSSMSQVVCFAADPSA